MQLTEIEKRSIFKALATKGQLAVGTEFGLDKHYSKPANVVNLVNRVYKEIRNDPEKFAIAPEVVSLVVKSMEERSKRGRPASNELDIIPGKVNERDLVLGARHKAWVLLNKKLDYLGKHPKAFKAESIMSIAKLAGIVFDKAQIVSGEATEHISLKAHIEEGISSQQAVEQLMKFREGQMNNESD